MDEPGTYRFIPLARDTVDVSAIARLMLNATPSGHDFYKNFSDMLTDLESKALEPDTHTNKISAQSTKEQFGTFTFIRDVRELHAVLKILAGVAPDPALTDAMPDSAAMGDTQNRLTRADRLVLARASQTIDAIKHYTD